MLPCSGTGRQKNAIGLVASTSRGRAPARRTAAGRPARARQERSGYCPSSRRGRARRVPARSSRRRCGPTRRRPASRAASQRSHGAAASRTPGRPAQNAHTNGRPVIAVHSSPRSTLRTPAALGIEEQRRVADDQRGVAARAASRRHRAPSARTRDRCRTARRTGSGAARSRCASWCRRRWCAPAGSGVRQNSATDATGPSDTIARSRDEPIASWPRRILDRRDHPEIDGVLVQQRGALRRRVEAQREQRALQLEPVDQRRAFRYATAPSRIRLMIGTCDATVRDQRRTAIALDRLQARRADVAANLLERAAPRAQHPRIDRGHAVDVVGAHRQRDLGELRAVRAASRPGSTGCSRRAAAPPPPASRRHTRWSAPRSRSRAGSGANARKPPTALLQIARARHASRCAAPARPRARSSAARRGRRPVPR